MTYLSPADRARSAAPAGSLMKTPDYLEALVTKDLKPFNWRKTVEQVKQVDNMVAEENQRLKLKFDAMRENIRRRKLARLHNTLLRGQEMGNNSRTTCFSAYHLLAAFCAVRGVKKQVMCGKSRRCDVARNRHILTWILYRNSGLSTTDCSRMLNRVDHTTTINSMRNIENNADLRELATAVEVEVLLKLRHGTNHD